MALRLRVLGSGSTGNATLVEGGGTRILIDAGLGPRQLAERLASAGVDPASLAAVVLSHEHHDHARGAASFSARWGPRLVGTRGTYAAAGFGAEEHSGYDVLEPEKPQRFGALEVLGVRVPHDAAGPLAFVVSCGGRSLGHATDLGHLGAGLVAALQACDALLIESNYDPVLLREGDYPFTLKERILGPLGHLSNGDVARYLGGGLGTRCQDVLLAHLSQKNNHPELALMACEGALRRAGRRDVRLGLTSAEGTGWIEVAPEGARRAAGQLALF